MYIKSTPNESGAYSAPQSNKFPGSVLLPNDMLTQFLEYNGFVTLTIEDGVVTGMTPNTTAWENWKASLPPEQPPQPTTEERLYALESAMMAMMGVTVNV